MDQPRCTWAGNDPLYRHYHDCEWGVPCHDERLLFEMLSLEGAQAGLSWITILKKRDNYRQAFDNFDPAKIVRYRTRKIESLMNNPGIVRNRRKIEAVIRNSNAYLELTAQQGAFSDYLWQFVDGIPVTNHWRSLKQVPVSTPQAEAMSKALKNNGFSFVGPTICYAFMQAVGMVNDHTIDCFRHGEISRVSS
jgi:DNA-3-methyladenine glycosylase I